jgi:hypothetical protein
MRKQISAAKVKKLPVSTDVWVVDEKTGYAKRLFVIKYGKRVRLLRSLGDQVITIKDTPGYHYEVNEV